MGDAKIEIIEVEDGMAFLRGEESFVLKMKKWRERFFGFAIFNYRITKDDLEGICEPEITFGQWGTQEAMENFLAHKAVEKEKELNKITPQAGDLWKVSGVVGVIGSEDSPCPDDWPESGNIKSNPSWHTEVMSNYWYMIYRPKDGMLMVTAKHDLVERVPEGIVDGKNGWELVWREGK